MAFCSNCGKEVSDQAPVCPNCGHPQQRFGAQAAAAMRKTEGNAIACLILAIASFVVCPLIPAIIALVLAGKAKQALAADPNLDGESLVKAGVIIAWINIGLAAAFLLLMILLFAFGTWSTTTTFFTSEVHVVPTGLFTG